MTTLKFYLLTFSMLYFIDFASASNNLTQIIDTLIKSENYIIFQEDGKWGIMDAKENVIHMAEFEDIDRFYEDNVAVKLNGEWGLWSNGDIDFDAEPLAFHIVDKKPELNLECRSETDKFDMNTCNMRKLLEYIYSSIRYPTEAKENNIMGYAGIKFMVESNGDTSNFKIIKELGGGCDEEALRVVETIQYYDVPAYKDGVAVNSWITLPVKFKLE